MCAHVFFFFCSYMFFHFFHFTNFGHRTQMATNRRRPWLAMVYQNGKCAYKLQRGQPSTVLCGRHHSKWLLYKIQNPVEPTTGSGACTLLAKAFFVAFSLYTFFWPFFFQKKKKKKQNFWSLIVWRTKGVFDWKFF